MSYVKRINGYDIKDAIALHTYDTVSSFKADNNLKINEHIQTKGYNTVNDGGGASYKIREIAENEVADEHFIIAIENSNLVAELIHSKTINTLQIGGTSSNLGSILNYCFSKGYLNIYVPSGNYNISETVNINNHRTKLIIDGDITSTINGPVFKLQSYFNIFKFNGKFTGNETNTFLQIADNNLPSNYNIIEINELTKCGYCVVLAPNGGVGCAYNSIKFNLFQNYICGILLQSGDDGANYINENNFTGGRIECHNSIGIKTVKGSEQTDYYNGNVFTHIAIDEAVETAIDLNFASYNYFHDFRISEGLIGNTIIHFDSNSKGNFINNKSTLYLNKINCESTDGHAYNRVQSPNLANSNGVFVGEEVYYFKNLPVLCKTVKKVSYISAYNSSDFTLNGECYYDGMEVTIGSDSSSVNFVLPEIINDRNISSFVLRVSYKAANANFTLKTSANESIMTASDFGSAILNNAYYKIEKVRAKWVFYKIS